MPYDARLSNRCEPTVHIQPISTHLTNHIYNWILNNRVDDDALTKNPAKRGTDERCESDQIQESAHLKSPPQP